MVNRLRWNEKSVRDAEPAKGRDYKIFDTDVQGGSRSASTDPAVGPSPSTTRAKSESRFEAKGWACINTESPPDRNDHAKGRQAKTGFGGSKPDA